MGRQLFKHRREIQSRCRQLDSHQRGRCPQPSHSGLDRQPNDRLGRRGRQRLSEHRRQILRGYTDCDTHAYIHSYSDSNCCCYSYAYSNTNSYTYFDTETFTDAEIRANA